MDKAKMLELFGSDSEASDDEPAPRSTAASSSRAADFDDEDGLDGPADAVGEDDLFGGASDDDGVGARPSEPQVPSGEPLHYELPRLQCPSEEGHLYLAKMPNIVQIQPRPFESINPECLATELRTSRERNTAGEALYEMGGANVIRWRFHPETGERQSNTKLVRWSDGSMTLHVGAEVLSAPVQRIKGRKSQLYATHKGGNLECHGRFDERMLFQPVSIDSSTHRALTKKIANDEKSKQKRSIVMTATTEDPEKKKMAEERAWEDQRRLQHRQASRRRSADEYQGGPTLSADFLEADDDVEEGNLGAIKRRYKDQRAKAAQGRGAGVRKRGRYYKDADEASASGDEDDEMDERGWEREERRAAETGEMDDFIAADEDEDEESAEESDEFGGMDDDDDDEPVKPKKKR